MHFALFLSSLAGFLDAQCGFQSTFSFRFFFGGIFILNTYLIWKEKKKKKKKKIVQMECFSSLQNGMFLFEFPKDFITLVTL